MKQYGVLVVDDSAFMRRAISLILEKDPQFIVVGIARNGEEAVEKIQRLKPDLVTMDVEMPVMNGLIALEKIMKTNPVPVVMLSSYTKEGANETIQALELGAVDFFLKDYLLKNRMDDQNIQEFLIRLKGIAEVTLPSVTSQAHLSRREESKTRRSEIKLIFIGCSTGGPSALQTILPRFPADFPIPIVVAQHMPPGFTKPLAERFNTMCHLKVKEANNGQVIQPGTIYIAPSGYQTNFEKKQDGSVVFKIDNQEDAHVLYKPSIDISLSSVAPAFEDHLLTVILTGMGSDGMLGSSIVKKYRGTVFVEAEGSCIVYGMPKAVLEAGNADGQYLLSNMFDEIMTYLQ